MTASGWVTRPDEHGGLPEDSISQNPGNTTAAFLHSKKLQRRPAVDSNDTWASASRLQTRNKELKIQKNFLIQIKH